jgi:hypothetical protein
MVVIIQISFELEPELPQDTSLRVGDDEMMLFHVANLIENKARAADVPEFRVDLDLNSRQMVGAKDGVLTCPLDKCHYGSIPFKEIKPGVGLHEAPCQEIDGISQILV